jgi:hypothetical protein
VLDRLDQRPPQDPRASRWWGSSGTRSGTDPGEYRPIRPAAQPPRSAVPAAACSRDLRARPPRPLPQAGRANAGAADARPNHVSLTHYGAQPATVRRSGRPFDPKDLGMRGYVRPGERISSPIRVSSRERRAWESAMRQFGGLEAAIMHRSGPGAARHWSGRWSMTCKRTGRSRTRRC